MTIEDLKRLKKQCGYTNETISILSGVPLSTVQKVFAGVTKSPRHQTVEAIEFVLREANHMTPLVQEEAFSYIVPEVMYGRKGWPDKKQGEYTVEDYYNMPEDWRGELIDGVIYDMSSSAVRHQGIAGAVYQQAINHIEETGGPCLPMIGPVDVQLEKDNKTMVVPDMIILCDPGKLTDKSVVGAPDFVMEVLSRSTKHRDLTVKRQKYMEAGVLEYWIVDPVEERVVVYLREEPGIIHMYTFNDKVPVAVWGGAFAVDFERVKKHLTFLQRR